MRGRENLSRQLGWLSPQNWSRSNAYQGLAFGWQGWAWVYLQLMKAALAPQNSRTLDAIIRRLKSDRRRSSRFNSHLIGCGGSALIAALWAQTDQTIAKLLPVLIRRWIYASRFSRHRDLMLGDAGAVLACAEIEGNAPGNIPIAFIRDLYERGAAEVKRLLEEASQGGSISLGFAHGLAGHLFALQMGKAAFSELRPLAPLHDRCIELLDTKSFAVGHGAAVWPKTTDGEPVEIHSWCHGAPGIALALLGCFQISRNDNCRKLARKALEGNFRFSTRSRSFCCGSIGRSQILIEAYRATGNPSWLEKAKFVAQQNSRSVMQRVYSRSFHRGNLGLQYLKLRLVHPTLLPLPGLGLFSIAGRPSEKHV